ncbi:MAG: heparinase II/III-family protein [Clostridiales bacterium]|nr:heparinase II/III-family protein [Clostridiales bacterium]
MCRTEKRELEVKLEEYILCMEENAALMRDVPMPELDEQLFSLFEKTGNRLAYENVYFQRRKYLAVYGCLAILQTSLSNPGSSPGNLLKLEEVIRGICKEECWALPAHVDRANDPGWRRTVDLFAAETGGALAEILALAGEKLDPEVQKLARKAVMERVLTPFLESRAPYSWWERGDNNWNAVCAGSIGCAGIYLLTEEPEHLNPLLERIVDSLSYYIEGFADDGACLEGLGYFGYGFSYYVSFAELLYRYTKGKTDLLGPEKVRRIALFQQKCYFPSGRTLSFSDGGGNEKYRMGLTCALAKRFPEVEIPPAACAGGFETDPCYRFMAIYRDVIWTRGYLEDCDEAQIGSESQNSSESQAGNVSPVNASAGSILFCPTAGEYVLTDSTAGDSAYTVLPDAQWSLARGFSGGGMACKGGTNGEPHNHNDIGSFLYLLGDEMLLADLGAGEYTKAYFTEEKRYQILCSRSLGHNVPLIDGKEQKAGEPYRCDSFWSDEKGKTVIHFASAYGNHAVRDLVRTMKYDALSECLVVEDVLEAEGDPVVSMQENLVTEFQPRIEENCIIIKGKNHACRITVEDAAGRITAAEKKHYDHEGNSKVVFCLSWETPADGSKGRRCRFRIQWVK